MNIITPYIKPYSENLNLIGRAQATVRYHIWHLGKLAMFLDEYPLKNIMDITQEHLQEYRKYRKRKENRFGREDSAPVQNKHLSVIKLFFEYLKEEGYILKNPAESLQYSKNPKRLPKAALTNKEMKKLLRMPDTGTLLGYRDRTILEILYSTGLRRSELLALMIDDVDYQEGLIRVNQGKGAKDRIVPAGKIACKYLQTYILAIRPFFHRAKEYAHIFLSKRGGPLSKNALSELIIKYAKRADLKKTVTAHTLRRSCATEMIRNKASLMHVKELLGHSRVDTVQIYCDLTITDLKKAHEKCHPREKETW